MALNLLQLRTKAAELSGRYDLVDVDDSYSDNGMDFFIDSAISFLDLRPEGPNSSDELEDNTDKNFWSTEHPDILIMAILYKLEVFNRNSEGARDWLASIEFELTQLDMNQVSDDVIEINQIRD